MTQYVAVLANGGCLVIAQPGQHMLGDMMGLVVEHRVSFLLTVPVLGREYFASSWAPKASSLRTVIFCGEPLPKDLVDLVSKVVRAGCRWLGSARLAAVDSGGGGAVPLLLPSGSPDQQPPTRHEVGLLCLCPCRPHTPCRAQTPMVSHWGMQPHCWLPL